MDDADALKALREAGFSGGWVAVPAERPLTPEEVVHHARRAVAWMEPKLARMEAEGFPPALIERYRRDLQTQRRLAAGG